MSVTSDPTEPTARMFNTAAALARYGTEAELRAFVRESLPQASEDLVRAVVAGHLFCAHEDESAAQGRRAAH